jgi:hypothetical protein
MRALTAARMHISASARSAFANVQSHFIPEFDGLKIAVVVQALTAIISVHSRRNVRALHCPDLAYTSRPCCA